MRFLHLLQFVLCLALLSGSMPAHAKDKDEQGPDNPKRALTPDANQKSEAVEKQETRNNCLVRRPAFGDLEYLGMPNWSVGFTASTQAVKYTFGTKQASSAVTTGAGLAIRYYGKSPLGNEEAAKDLGFRQSDLDAIKKLEGGKYYKKDPDGEPANDKYYLPLYMVSTACRATTSDIGKDRTDKLASSVFSITPTVFYAKQANENDLSLQPALLLGFLDDILSIGPGFNLTGPEKGKVFLVLSLGYGFKF